MNPDDRLAVALWEADRHAAALSEALAEWAAQAALDMAQLERDRLLLRLTDQILFRFTKLQDALGERLVPATLQRLAEPFEDWPMRDRLERLQKLGYLPVDDWLRWRELRNRPAHEYPDQPELRFAVLKAAIGAAGELATAYAHCRQMLAQA
ncbi:MAG TPA: hypothetical protein PKB14_06150 [Rubrivivax sp.]|nr:hypothetical protein [Rubrivivax sp.]